MASIRAASAVTARRARAPRWRSRDRTGCRKGGRRPGRCAAGPAPRRRTPRRPAWPAGCWGEHAAPRRLGRGRALDLVGGRGRPALDDVLGGDLGRLELAGRPDRSAFRTTRWPGRLAGRAATAATALAHGAQDSASPGRDPARRARMPLPAPQETGPSARCDHCPRRRRRSAWRSSSRSSGGGSARSRHAFPV